MQACGWGVPHCRSTIRSWDHRETGSLGRGCVHLVDRSLSKPNRAHPPFGNGVQDPLSERCCQETESGCASTRHMKAIVQRGAGGGPVSTGPCPGASIAWCPPPTLSTSREIRCRLQTQGLGPLAAKLLLVGGRRDLFLWRLVGLAVHKCPSHTAEHLPWAHASHCSRHIAVATLQSADQ